MAMYLFKIYKRDLYTTPFCLVVRFILLTSLSSSTSNTDNLKTDWKKLPHNNLTIENQRNTFFWYTYTTCSAPLQIYTPSSHFSNSYFHDLSHWESRCWITNYSLLHTRHTCKGHRAEVVILGRRFTPTLLADNQPICEKQRVDQQIWSNVDLFFFWVSLWLVGSEVWIFYLKFIISEFQTEMCSGYKQNATLTTVSCWSKTFFYEIG